MDNLLMIDRTIRTFKRVQAMDLSADTCTESAKMASDLALGSKFNHCLFCHFDYYGEEGGNVPCRACPFEVVFGYDCYAAGYGDSIGELNLPELLRHLTIIRTFYAGYPIPQCDICQCYSEDFRQIGDRVVCPHCITFVLDL